MLAKINGVFRLTRNAEIRYLTNSTALVKLSLVNSEKYKDKETILYIDAVAFGKAAELINQYSGMKGNQISLAGKLQTESWVDNNQQKRSKISMVIEDFEFIGSRENNQNLENQEYGDNGTPIAQNQAPAQQQQQQSQSYQAPSQQQQSYQQPARQMPSSNEVPVIDIDDSDIPF